MSIRTPDSERVDTDSLPAARRERSRFERDSQLLLDKGNYMLQVSVARHSLYMIYQKRTLGVGIAELDVWGDRAVLQGQNCFDQAGDT
jgi:hypothetical protein